MFSAIYFNCRITARQAKFLCRQFQILTMEETNVLSFKSSINLLDQNKQPFSRFL